LRNHGGDVVSRVARGESLVVTRDGSPVAELRPISRQGVSAAALLARWRTLPHLDLQKLRRDLDEVVDPWL